MPVSKSKLAVGLFIFSEANFFLILIVSYIYFHVVSAGGPSAGNSLNPLRTGLFSVALFASSATMALAHHAFRHGRRRGLVIWLALTIVLGAIFLIGESFEWAGLFSRNITVATNLFGSTFFTLTGFHGLHVFIGLCMLAIMLGVAGSGRMALPQTPAMIEGEGLQAGFESVAMYWHFVDAVWVFIFGLVYLWPFF
ncbi:MAG: cytochrome c oxidase subunit 3 [Candidatus Binataceae bacterium]